MKYEYKLHSAALDLTPHFVERILNEFGLERWRLIDFHATAATMSFIFMRELKQEIVSVEGGLNE